MSHLTPRRRSRGGSWSSLARSRRRGQALFEFALVAPLFFVVVLAAAQLFTWSYDQQVGARAVRLGASSGNEAMASVNLRFALDPHLATVYLPGPPPVNEKVFTDLPPDAAACRETTNKIVGGVIPTARLGWDWGCLYNLDTGAASARHGNIVSGDDAASLRAPLDAALKSAYAELGRLYVGPLSSGTISACYAIWDTGLSPAAPRCVLERIGTFGNSLGGPSTLTLAWEGGGAPQIDTVCQSPLTDPRTCTNGPSFLTVSLKVEALSLQGHDLFNINDQTVQVLNRFITSCTAPLNYSDYTAGSCGSAF